ncbi:DUF4400 domain-containing protein [Stutzerimonas stutzeri]|uniref:DUF4400 domain-containing protein n=1 Tax=Stutzerimonas stutzeri TaxID=316 RepID=A0A0D7E2W2_STUST|nr:DUF4400 domain-containing protein [Stutzerimonas stutzeri]KIZ34851.1 hypothetical protein LO50_15790 [Stutzerimonas stutzeri]
MAEVIEEKWPKGLVASLFFLFIMVLMLAVFAPNPMIDTVMQKERQWSVSLLPQDDLKRIDETTASIYTALVIDSGLKYHISGMFMRSGPSTVDSFEEKVGWWFEYLDSRGVALQKITYQILYRAVLMTYWMPFFAVMAVPAIFAGFMRWQAKRHGFDYSSPFWNNNAVSLMGWGGIMLALSLLAPLPLPPMVVCTALIIILPILLSVLIRNLPKQI